MSRTFKQEFFRIYDRKIGAGEITFSQTGISKEDFTRLCTQEDFVFNPEAIERLALNMKLTDEERLLLLSSAERETAR